MSDATASPVALDIQAIMRVLPHRYPFLLVDRVVHCEPGKDISGYKNITRNEPFFVQPCSAETVMPDMLVVEAMAQIAVILTYKTLDLPAEANPLFFFAGIDDAKFTGEVRPGDRLELGSSVVRLMASRGIGKFATWAEVDGKRVAEATMIAAMKSSNTN
jgi:3-hydroxyacyl-[acyl-carrier-protein] dehydratase